MICSPANRILSPESSCIDTVSSTYAGHGFPHVLFTANDLLHALQSQILCDVATVNDEMGREREAERQV